MTDKANTTAKPKILHTERSGEVTATVTERQTMSGYAYPQIALSREWSGQSSGKRVHTSNCFFAKHAEDVVLVIRRTADWLRETHAALTVSAADGPSEEAQ